jgi:hypothetical protein
MEKPSEYRDHAEECRTLARTIEMSEYRTRLLEMAATWDKLADERSASVRKHALAKDGRPWGADASLRRPIPRSG